MIRWLVAFFLLAVVMFYTYCAANEFDYDPSDKE